MKFLEVHVIYLVPQFGFLSQALSTCISKGMTVKHYTNEYNLYNLTLILSVIMITKGKLLWSNICTTQPEKHIYIKNVQHYSTKACVRNNTANSKSKPFVCTICCTITGMKLINRVLAFKSYCNNTIPQNKMPESI